MDPWPVRVKKISHGMAYPVAAIVEKTYRYPAAGILPKAALAAPLVSDAPIAGSKMGEYLDMKLPFCVYCLYKSSADHKTCQV